MLITTLGKFFMNKKVLAVILLIAVYFYASPYITLHNMKNAVEANDSNKVSTYINFPSVRQNLKDQVNAYIMKKMSTSNRTDGMEQLSSMFAMSMVEKIVDLAITPEGITLMMQGKKPNTGFNTPSHTSTSNTANSVETYSTRYLSFNQFEVNIKAQGKPETISIVLERDGLSWKVVKINIPMDNH
jgi:hypothetical protein